MEEEITTVSILSEEADLISSGYPRDPGMVIDDADDFSSCVIVTPTIDQIKQIEWVRSLNPKIPFGPPPCKREFSGLVCERKDGHNGSCRWRLKPDDLDRDIRLKRLRAGIMKIGEV